LQTHIVVLVSYRFFVIPRFYFYFS